MKDILTICPFCGCGCGLYLQIESGEVTGVTPSQLHPISRGRLCARGWHCYEFIQHPDRLTKPLIKKKDGTFKPVIWEEALELISKNFESIKDKYGSDSIGIISSAKCTNEENFLLMKFARTVLETNNIDNGASLYDPVTLPGLRSTIGTGVMTNSINEIEDAEVLFVLGSDTTKVHPQIGARIINATLKGAKLILVDPRKTHLSQFARLHLQLKPGAYIGLINGIIYEIINNRLIDEKTISQLTTNYNELKSLVNKYTPIYVEKVTGVSQSDIREAAKIYSSTNRAMIIYSTYLTQYASGIDNVKALANLVILTQHLGKSYMGINPLLEQNNALGAADMGALPDFYSGYQRDREKFERAWNTKLPTNSGLTILEMFKSDRLKAMYIIGENPLITAPDVGNVKEALIALDFLIVQDIFLTETAEFADVVLPAACFAEKDGTFTNTERRIQRVRKAIEPPADSMSDWMIINKLANKMGHRWEYQTPADIMKEIAKLTPIYGGIEYNKLDKTWGIQWPCPDKDHPGCSVLHKGFFEDAKTYFSLIEQDGLGKPSFTPVEDIPLVEPPDENYQFTLTTGSLYYHWHSGTMTRRSATLNREYPDVFAAINPKDAEQFNIREGERIRVISRRGELETAAMLTDMVQEKTIFIPLHYRETATKVLINPSLENHGNIPELLCAVRIEKL